MVNIPIQYVSQGYPGGSILLTLSFLLILLKIYLYKNLFKKDLIFKDLD